MARDLDGADDYINFGTAAASELPIKTIACWLRIDSSAGFNTLLAKGVLDATGWRLFRNFGAETLAWDQRFTGTDGRWSTPAFGLNVAKYVTVAYDRGSVANDPTVWYDAVSQTVTEDSTPTGSAESDAASPLFVGMEEDGITGAFDGLAADLAIWSAILTQAEVTDLAAGLDPLQIRRSSLALFARLCGDNSPEPDESGNGYLGTVVGTTRAEHPPKIVGSCLRRDPLRGKLFSGRPTLFRG